MSIPLFHGTVVTGEIKRIYTFTARWDISIFIKEPDLSMRGFITIGARAGIEVDSLAVRAFPTRVAGKIVLAVVAVIRGRVPGVTERHGCIVANFEAIRKLAFMVGRWWCLSFGCGSGAGVCTGVGIMTFLWRVGESKPSKEHSSTVRYCTVLE